MRIKSVCYDMLHAAAVRKNQSLLMSTHFLMNSLISPQYSEARLRVFRVWSARSRFFPDEHCQSFEVFRDTINLSCSWLVKFSANSPPRQLELPFTCPTFSYWSQVATSWLCSSQWSPPQRTLQFTKTIMVQLVGATVHLESCSTF